ncbi:Na+/H+ antiporter [Streptomyces sp. NPDC004658]|uniref:Na+/H+ antiporter n=1 Tax=Streptomyces sp. NPDC004658 TaxID=3154672 RepID=UPI0033B073CE
MLGLELVVLLGFAALLGNVGAKRFRIAPPVLLLAAGMLLGFVPALRQVHLPSEVVLLLFLPVLLYWESLNTSLREIRVNLRGIVLLSTTLVIATAAIVAVTAHALGLPWGPAWVLGAAVAPTDATAVSIVGRLLPRGQVTVLRAESLVNDGTALVVYGVAVGITVGREHLEALHITWLFVRAYLGGALVGAAVAGIAVWVRRRIKDEPLHGQVLMLLVPFTTYLIAQEIGASGVVAVVVCGLIMSQVAPRVVRADMRLQANAFWTVATYLLNGSLFVLVGLELHSSVRTLSAADLPRAALTAVAVTVVLIAARLAHLFGSAYLIRALDRRPRQLLLRVSNRSRVVSGLCGFRGAVSLAAALAVPLQLDSGAPFPDRNVIVFVTGGVIVLTLLQGLVLPAVVRWARLPQDTSVERERRLAESTATQEALAALPRLADELGVGDDVADRLRVEYEKHLAFIRARADGDEEHPALREEQEYRRLRQALIATKRVALVRLRDERRIDDTVLRHLVAQLDIEDVGLASRQATD